MRITFIGKSAGTFAILFLLGITRLSAQIAHNPPSLNVTNLVHPNRELANRDKESGRLWKSIGFDVDINSGEVQLTGASPIAPKPQNEVQSTLVLEYVMASGRSIRVPAATPWNNHSGAKVPTDEDGLAIRVYDADGKLIGECKDVRVPRKAMYAFDLARIDDDKLGFHNKGRHVKMETHEKVIRWGPSLNPTCSLRWSWDGGQNWSDPDSVRGDDAITWPLTPEIQEKLKQNPDPLIEVLHSVGLKLIRKTYHFQDLSRVKNEVPEEKSETGK